MRRVWVVEMRGKGEKWWATSSCAASQIDAYAELGRMSEDHQNRECRLAKYVPARPEEAEDVEGG